MVLSVRTLHNMALEQYVSILVYVHIMYILRIMYIYDTWYVRIYLV